jgi:hypothetical protein
MGAQSRVKRTVAISLPLVFCLLMLVACGSSSSSSSSTKPASGLKTRAFASNSFSGVIQIIDYTDDVLSGSTIPASGTPAPMYISADRSKTIAFDTSSNAVTVITNSTEAVAGTIALPPTGAGGVVFSRNSFAISSDGSVAWAAVRNATVTNGSDGIVAELDLVNLVIKAEIPLPHAKYLALSNDNSTLLAFADDSNAMRVINTGNATVVSTTSGSGSSTLDRPVAAYFSSDNTTAFILNCGPGCGGTQASLIPFTVSSQQFGSTVPLQAANIGLLSGSTLYVAGQSITQADGSVVPGVLNSFDVTTPAQPGQPSTISVGTGNTGVPDVMALEGSSLFIGSQQCGNYVCLSIVNTSSNTLILPAGTQGCSSLAGCQVTGLAPIPTRNAVYVAEGGVLYSLHSDTGQPINQVGITGQIQDVIIVDK